MRKMRLPILIAITVAIIGIIFGSIFDYQLSCAIASPTNGFALGVSIIAPTLGFCGFAFVGGAFIALAIHQEWKMWIKLFFYGLAIAAYGVTVYYAGKEYFGENGFAGAAPMIVGYIIAAVCGIGAEVGGYFVFKGCKNRNAWLALLFVYVILLLVLLGAITILKSIMHRPRFRELMDPDSPAHFFNWWQPNKDYKYYVETCGRAKENFKSFPSGHTGEAAVLMVVSVFVPLANEKLRKIQIPLFICSGCFVILVAFSRILAAAHFLSDVSMGALVTLLFTYIANEIAIHLKPLHQEEE